MECILIKYGDDFDLVLPAHGDSYRSKQGQSLEAFLTAAKAEIFDDYRVHVKTKTPVKTIGASYIRKARIMSDEKLESRAARKVGLEADILYSLIKERAEILEAREIADATEVEIEIARAQKQSATSPQVERPRKYVPKIAGKHQTDEQAAAEADLMRVNVGRRCTFEDKASKQEFVGRVQSVIFDKRTNRVYFRIMGDHSGRVMRSKNNLIFI